MKRLLAPKVLHPRPLQRPIVYCATTAVSPPPTAPRATPETPAASLQLALAGEASDEEQLLEHSFFAAGLSEDSLRAISERERERDSVELSLTASAGQRMVLGVALCAGVAVLAFAGQRLLGQRSLSWDGRAPVALATPPSPPPAQEATPPPESTPAPRPETMLAAVAVLPSAEEPAAEPEADPGPEPASEPAVPTADTVAVGIAPTPPPVRRRPTLTAADLRAQVATALAGGSSLELRAEPGTGASQEACAQLLRRGSFSAIRTTCTAAFAARPDAQLAGEIARAALDDRHHREAAAWARKAIAADGRFADAFVTLGTAEGELGRPGAAREAYSRYLQLEPNGPQAAEVRAVIEKL